MERTNREGGRRGCAELDVRWARSAVGRALHAAVFDGFFVPAVAYYTRPGVVGAERLDAIAGPVVLVANHASHLDTPLLLRSLPRRRRRRTAVAAAADYFFVDRLRATVVALAFNAVPVRRDGGGSGELTHVDELLSRGWSLVVYPEGTRKRDEDEGRLRTGAIVLAARHGLPVVPVRLTGTREVLPPGRLWPRRWPWAPRPPVGVTVGAPIRPTGPEDRHDAIARIEAFFAGEDVERDVAAPVR